MTLVPPALQIAGVDYVYFIQENTLDRRERTLHIESRNETFSNRVVIHETCCYSVSLPGPPRAPPRPRPGPPHRGP